MLETPTKLEILLIVPNSLGLHVTPEQFETLALANPFYSLSKSLSTTLPCLN